MTQNRPPQPGPTPGTKSGSVTHGPSVVEAMREGGAPMVGPQPTSELGADVSKGLAQAGQIGSQIDKDFAEPVPARAGDDTNKSKGAGISGGFPNAGQGPGTGRPARGVTAPPPKSPPRGGPLPPGFSGPRK